jgi:hypothetical protein
MLHGLVIQRELDWINEAGEARLLNRGVHLEEVEFQMGDVSPKSHQGGGR